MKKKFKFIIFAFMALVIAFSNMLIQNRTIKISAAGLDPVCIWASCGTLTNGSLFKMVEVAINDPEMIAKGYSADQVISLKNQLATIFEAEKTSIISDFVQKVNVYTADQAERETLVNELIVTNSIDNTIVSVRFLRIEFRTTRAFNIYSNNATTTPVVTNSFFVTTITETNPIIFWGVQENDTFIDELDSQLSSFIPPEEADGIVLEPHVYYQFQTLFRRIHSNANLIEFQMSGMYLHEWEVADNMEFILYRNEPTRYAWYTLALVATAIFVLIALLIVKRVSKKKRKNSNVSGQQTTSQIQNETPNEKI